MLKSAQTLGGILGASENMESLNEHMIINQNIHSPKENSQYIANKQENSKISKN